jgi:hypothetical protein
MFQRLDLLPAGLTVCVEPKKYKRVNNLATYVGVYACISYGSLLKTLMEGKSERSYVELCSVWPAEPVGRMKGSTGRKCTAHRFKEAYIRTFPEFGDQGDYQHSRAPPRPASTLPLCLANLYSQKTRVPLYVASY